MPARNAASTINESINSVLSQALLGELIVVDDGSTDASGDIARGLGDPRLRVVDGPQMGISAALNAGVEQATHPYVARCDADDLFVSGRLRRQVAWLEAHSEYVAITGGFESMTANGKPVAALATGGVARDVTDDLRAGQGHTSLCSWLIRTKAWGAAGGARVWFETAEDIDMQFRLAFIGRVWHEPHVVYHYRLHDSSISHSRSKEQLAFYDHWVKEFARQRAERGSDDLDDGHPPEVPDFGAGQKRNSWRRQAIGHLIGLAWSAHGRGEVTEARRIAMQAIRLDPRRASSWKTLALVTTRKPK